MRTTKTPKDATTRAARAAKSREEATATFAANCEEIRRLADALVESAEDHFCITPEKVDWVSVGDTARILSDLREILAYARPTTQTDRR